MYNRRFFDSPLGKAALVSITAMVMLNVAAAMAGGSPSLGIEAGLEMSIPSMMVTLA